MSAEESFIAGLEKWNSKGKVQEAKKRLLAAFKERSSELNLKGLMLTSLPPEIGRLTHLTSLSLSCNMLTSLPKEIGQLIHLTHLDLSRNELKFLPPEMDRLTRLKVLDLSQNQFEPPSG